MKQIFSFILALIISQNVVAQGVSAGLRTGVGSTLQIGNLQDGFIHKTWDKELFLRYETKGRWAFEINANQYNNNYHTEPLIFECCFGPCTTSETLDIYSKNSIVDIAFSAQYDISCSYLKEHCPVMKNLRSFIGVNIGAGYTKSTDIYTERQYSDGMVTKNNNEYQSLSLPQVGLSHTLTYSFGNIFLASSINMMLSPLSNMNYRIYQDNYYNSKLSGRIGFGYRF